MKDFFKLLQSGFKKFNEYSLVMFIVISVLIVAVIAIGYVQDLIMMD